MKRTAATKDERNSIIQDVTLADSLLSVTRVSPLASRCPRTLR